jgi:hypothetical protein
VLDSIPESILALLAPPAIWANVAWVSPFLKTNRHGLSGLISVVAGLAMFAAFALGPAHFIAPFVFSCIAVLGMLLVMFWPLPVTQKNSHHRKRRRKAG